MGTADSIKMKYGREDLDKGMQYYEDKETVWRKKIAHCLEIFRSASHSFSRSGQLMTGAGFDVGRKA